MAAKPDYSYSFQMDLSSMVVYAITNIHNGLAVLDLLCFSFHLIQSARAPNDLMLESVNALLKVLFKYALKERAHIFTKVDQ